MLFYRAALPLSSRTLRYVAGMIRRHRKSIWSRWRRMNKPQSQKDANRAHAKLRAPGERANAQLKTWKILRKLRCCPWKAGAARQGGL